jgi:5-methylcytosine-specific restriction endonuclease McrA
MISPTRRAYIEKNREKIMKQQNDWYKKRHEKLEALFGSVCYCCGQNGGKRMEFHHLRYIEGELRRTGSTILNQVEAHPETFKLLCNRCHYSVTTLMREPRASKILEVVQLSGGAKP